MQNHYDVWKSTPISHIYLSQQYNIDMISPDAEHIKLFGIYCGN